MSHLDATADLLKVAGTTLRETVIPHVAADGRFPAAMVVNAIAIAAREIELGPAARAAERAMLAAFYATPDATLTELRARFCRDLRSGALGEERENEVRVLLRQAVRQRLAISNPAYGRAVSPEAE